MNQKTEELKGRLYSKALFSSKIKLSGEVSDGFSRQGLLYFFMAAGDTPLRIDGGRCEGCFGLRPGTYEYVSALATAWGVRNATVDKVKKAVRHFVKSGLMATVARRRNGAKRGTVFVLLDWSKFQDSDMEDLPAEFDKLREKIVAGFEIRFRKSSEEKMPGEVKCGSRTLVQNEVKCRNRTSETPGVKCQIGTSNSFETTKKNKVGGWKEISTMKYKEQPEREEPPTSQTIAFQDGRLVITTEQDAAWRNDPDFKILTFPDVYEEMAAWAQAQGVDIDNPGMFAYRWLCEMVGKSPYPGRNDVERHVHACERPKRTRRQAPEAPQDIVFQTRRLKIDSDLDGYLAQRWPQVNRQAQYVEADGWLFSNPKEKRKNIRLFMINWFKKIRKQADGIGAGQSPGAASYGGNGLEIPLAENPYESMYDRAKDQSAGQSYLGGMEIPAAESVRRG